MNLPSTAPANDREVPESPPGFDHPAEPCESGRVPSIGGRSAMVSIRRDGERSGVAFCRRPALRPITRGVPMSEVIEWWNGYVDGLD